MTRARRAVYWLAPPAVCLALYWRGLGTWFMQDDFAWLRLAREVLEGGSLRDALLSPMAQGTVRPFSERGFFIGLYALFGLDSLPFRICVFLTQIANLVLISSIARRFTGSRMAGLLAPILWLCGSTMYVVMTWNSVYNQVLCAFCLLLAFYFFLRYLETGRRRWYWLQWVPFLAGFGVLEIVVVYPVLATWFARKHWRATLPMFAVSAAFGLWHALAIPKAATGTYGMYFDGAIIQTLWTYWQWALGPAQLAMVVRAAPWLIAAATIALSAAVLAGVIAGGRLPLFFLAWFLTTLAPVLPLRNHTSDYYLTVPGIGLAMLGAWALARFRAVAAAAVALYLAVSLPAAYIGARASYLQTKEVEHVVLGVSRAHQLYPERVILLDGASEELYWNALRHSAFEVVGAPWVYLTPGSHPVAAQFTMPSEPVLRALDHGEAVVYDVRGPRLRNVTRFYKATAPSRFAARAPSRVDVANPLMAYLLGPEWYPPDQGSRWMPGRATLRLAGPDRAGRQLFLSGRCARPARVRVSVEGANLAEIDVTPGSFDLPFTLPAATVGKDRLEVAVEVDRTFRAPPDDRDLGLAFGVFEIR